MLTPQNSVWSDRCSQVGARYTLPYSQPLNAARVCHICSYLSAVSKLTWTPSKPRFRFQFSFPKIAVLVFKPTQHYTDFQSIFTVRRSYASAVLEVIILSVRLSHACFVINPKNLLAIFLHHSPHERAILLVFLMPKISAKFQRGHSQRGRQIEVG